MLTVDILNKITKAGNGGTINPSYIGQFVSDCNSVLPKYGINSPRAVSMFLANVLHETGNLRSIEENLNYTTTTRLRAVWPSRFKTDKAAQPYVRNPKALANNVYANRMGNGSEASGDGWRYRGRSYPHLTGRDAYRAVGKLMGIDIETNPDLLLDRKYGVLCGASFWKWKGITVTNSTPLKTVAVKWNGGTVGLPERQKIFDQAMKYLAGRSFESDGVGVVLPTENIPVPTPRPSTPKIIAKRGDKNSYVKQTQEKLKELGYGLDADGAFGIMTRDAIMAFQADNGITPTPDYIDEDTYDVIMKSDQVKPSKELLADVTAKELKEKGSVPVKQADNLQKLGLIGTGIGAVKGVSEMVPPDVLNNTDQYIDQFHAFQGIVSSLNDIWIWASQYWWLLLIIAFVLVFLYAKKMKDNTVQEYKDGVRNKV
ncbi:chitinase [Ochrobactrum phage vB_OspM_OC]|nr:chitinase [Ochrobactrum phage vB_OspM_OC]